MAKDYIEITREISAGMREMRKDMPDVMQGFSALAGAATKDNVLSKKVKEFVALGIGISTRCDGCIGFHTKALIDLGATRQEFEEVLAMAIYMGGGPSVMYAANAMLAWEQFSAKVE
ncbi:carboxymuconolactone decarboxylase family protein [Allorhizobium borbori]|uniref:AhpD family alkylhydroperoxidase n=1 Tax=Allorhizobium borbori TaxID=485907 RepID=A0A7W6K671_9HYPH|nr:carboxymuconolactone decarboxylase family protein [Allorhizobium borbori]MBB4104870.1 AhpD family alkylhydroperoxidase [Allorhizobium borbori]PZU25119.1 MAG: alkylhydroperoxidase [Shinella sp.]